MELDDSENQIKNNQKTSRGRERRHVAILTPFQNTGTEVAALIGILAFGLLLRLVQYMRFKYPGGPDLFFFLSYMKNIEEFFRNVQPYPFFFPLFSRALQKIFKLSDQRLLLIGAVPDLITGLIAYFFTRIYFGVLASLAALALFITTPALVHQSTFGPRSMGLLLYSSSLLVLTLPFPLNGFSILFVSLTALTHKLSIQTLFFVFLVYGFFDLTALFYFALGLLLAFALSKMKYYAVFHFHLSYVKLMMTKPEARYPNKELLMFANVPYAVLAPLAIVILHPETTSKITLDSLNVLVVAFWHQPVGRLLLVWASIPFLLVFLWRWGDSNRYIIYSSLPLAVLFSAVSGSENLPYYSLLVLLANVVIALYITRRNTPTSPGFLEAVDFLSKVLEDGFCCPEKYYLAVKYLTQGKGVYIDKRDPLRIVKPRWEQTDRFRYFVIPCLMLNDLAREYSVKVLFSNEEWVVGKTESTSG